MDEESRQGDKPELCKGPSNTISVWNKGTEETRQGFRADKWAGLKDCKHQMQVVVLKITGELPIMQ
eukprot:13553719-Ditylum_brightwellii.AAC.1